MAYREEGILIYRDSTGTATFSTTDRSVIGQARDRLWSVDLFRCESILLKNYWVMVVMDIFTRRIIGFGVAAANLDGPSECRMFNRAIAIQNMPRHLSSDHDPLFRFQRWLANLRILEIDEIKTIPCTPRSHAFIERKLDSYKVYYNRHRCHTGLGGLTPAQRSGVPPHPIANLDSFRWRKHCNGLFQTPAAA